VSAQGEAQGEVQGEAQIEPLKKEGQDKSPR